MRLKHLVLLCIVYQSVEGSTTTEKLEILTAEYVNENSPSPQQDQDQDANLELPMKSINDLVLQQTEAIKKIISEQQITQHDTDADVERLESIKTTHVVETDSIEDLKKKCQHLSRIFNSAAPTAPTPQDARTEKPKVVEAFGPYMRPDLLRFKPKFPSPPSINMPQPPPPAPQMSGNYFIFTQNPEMYSGHRINKYSDKMDVAASSVEEDIVSPPSEEYEDLETEEEEPVTPTTTTTAQPEVDAVSQLITTMSYGSSTTEVPRPKFKYVRLEPIILKKILQPTGRTSLYWYRLLPTTQSFVQILDTPENEGVKVVAQPQNYHNEASLPAQYQYYVDPRSGLIKPNTPNTANAATTTSTTTPAPSPTPQNRPQFFINPQTGLIYQSALPHQFIFHKRVPLPTTESTLTTSATTTTTEKISVPVYTIDLTQPEGTQEKPAEDTTSPTKQFKHEFRFVIPMVVTGTQDELSNYPYRLDPYAYLPKGQRPATMNLPVPYVPNYQMIRKLTIPNTNQLQELAMTKDK